MIPRGPVAPTRPRKAEASFPVTAEPVIEIDPELEDAFKEMHSAAVVKASTEQLEASLMTFLTCYLSIIKTPSDEQVHSLAKSIGLSKEALEQVIYSMLSERLTAASPPFDENEDYPPQPSGYGPSIITDPIDTDERLANDGIPDEHIIRIRRGEIDRAAGK